MFKFISFSCLFFLCFFIGCQNSTEPGGTPLKSLDFKDKLPVKMFWKDPYLYVCAGRDGLWRTKSFIYDKWEYLGLGDQRFIDDLPRGVLDAEILGNDIIVAYWGSLEDGDPRETVGIWRSSNSGKDWYRSDNGVPETITSPYEFNTFSDIERSPFNSNLLFAIVPPAVYRSEDNGISWQLINFTRGLMSISGNVKFNPFRVGEAWFFGETSTFSGFLYNTKNNGDTFSESVNLPADNNILDVAFNSNNPDIVYAATLQGLVKTSDGGTNWSVISPEIPGTITRILNTADNHKFVATWRNEIYYSNDDLGTFKLIKSISDGDIISLEEGNNTLFIGTDKGIYTIKINEDL